MENRKPYEVKVAYTNSKGNSCEAVLDVYNIEYSPKEGMVAFIQLNSTLLKPMASIEHIEISSWNASGDNR